MTYTYIYRPNWIVVVFVGGCQNNAAPKVTSLPDKSAIQVCLQTDDDVYPPREKEFAMWAWISEISRKGSGGLAELRMYHTATGGWSEKGAESLEFEYFVKMDMDTYFNHARFVDFLKHARRLEATATQTNGANLLYAGFPGKGRKEERASLGLHGGFYCHTPSLLLDLQLVTL